DVLQRLHAVGVRPRHASNSQLRTWFHIPHFFACSNRQNTRSGAGPGSTFNFACLLVIPAGVSRRRAADAKGLCSIKGGWTKDKERRETGRFPGRATPSGRTACGWTLPRRVTGQRPAARRYAAAV